MDADAESSLPQDRYLIAVAPDDVRIQGTRVGLEHVLSSYLIGRLPEEIALEYPTLNLEQVHGVIAYYLRHRAAVDAYLRQVQARTSLARMEQKNKPQAAVVNRLRELVRERVG